MKSTCISAPLHTYKQNSSPLFIFALRLCCDSFFRVYIAASIVESQEEGGAEAGHLENKNRTKTKRKRNLYMEPRSAEQGTHGVSPALSSSSSSPSPLPGPHVKQRPAPLEIPQDNSYGTFFDGNHSHGSGARGNASDPRTTGSLPPHQKHHDDHSISDEDVYHRRKASSPLWRYVASPNSPIVIIRDHCQQQWAAVLLTLVLLFVMVYFVFAVSSPVRADRCITPFGVFLGEHNSVAAYSNCRNDYGGDGGDHFVSVGLQRLYTGPRWSAMEYARRYWILSFLASLPIAATPEMLLTTPSVSLVNGQRGGRGSAIVALEQYQNLFTPHHPGLNQSSSDSVNGNGVPVALAAARRRLAMPKTGDLVIYAKHEKTLPLGHIAVIAALHGPYKSIRAAGAEVRWYIQKNASAKTRRPLHPEVVAVAEEESDTAATTAPTPMMPPENLSGTGVVEYYKIYIAEQNWSNNFWVKTSESQNATTSEALATGAKRLGYSRILLLHYYKDDGTYFIEDTHNNLILGWVRVSSPATP